jgi:hypothetical protein
MAHIWPYMGMAILKKYGHIYGRNKSSHIWAIYGSTALNQPIAQ